MTQRNNGKVGLNITLGSVDIGLITIKDYIWMGEDFFLTEAD